MRFHSASSRRLPWLCMESLPLVAAALAVCLGSSARAPCPIGQGATGLVWPLGEDGYAARELYSTHGQYQRFDPDPADVHCGIDMGACPGEEIYAVEDGTVVASTFEDSSLGGDPSYRWHTVIVSRGGELARGIKYMHLAETDVKIGSRVERDQFLGTVVAWLPSGYDHLHLQAVTRYDSGAGTDEAWGLAEAADAGDPLPLFVTLEDAQPPVVEALRSSRGELASFLFFSDAGGAEIDPPLRGAVDIVARVHDLFPGSGPSSCDREIPAQVTPAIRVAPRSLLLRVIGPFDAQADATPFVPTGPVAFNRELDLSAAIGSADRATWVKHVYQPDSVGTYAERDLRFILTHDPATGGAWQATAPGEYWIELTLKDATGNTTVETTKVVVELP